MQKDALQQLLSDEISPATILLCVFSPLCDAKTARSQFIRLEMTNAWCFCHRCQLSENEAECIVGLDNSHFKLFDCHMHNTAGPAVDLTDASALNAEQGSVQDCVGVCLTTGFGRLLVNRLCVATRP